MKLITLHLLLAITTINEWELNQVDVNNAFFHGYLNKEVYMITPLDLQTRSCAY